MDQEDQNPVSEVVNADWHFDVIRTYVLGVEILDTRIGNAEFRLLALLRLRASGGRNNFVSHELLAKDLGVHEKTIAKNMKSLRDNGYITCKRRGFSTSTTKTITSMVERYDQDILSMSRKEILGANRSEDLLRRLHCEPTPPLGAKTPPMEIIKENDLHKDEKRTLIGSDNAPSLGAKSVPKVNKAKEIKFEVDVARVAREAPPTASQPTRIVGFSESGEAYDKSTGEVLSPLAPVLKSKVPEENSAAEDEADLRQQAAAAITVHAGVKAHEKGQEAVKKARVKRAEEDASGVTEEKLKLKSMTKAERMTTGAKMEQYFRDEYDLFFREVKSAHWSPREFGQLKMLLGFYDNDEKLIRRGWSFLCENWDDLTKKLKIADASPSIGLYLALRTRIMGLVQSRQTDRQLAERKPLSGTFEW